VVVDVGDAVKLDPDPEGNQLYVVPPEAETVVELPLHIVEGDAEAEMAAVELTVTVTVLVPIQPAALVPVTVYVVVEPGLTVMDAPVAPVLQM